VVEDVRPSVPSQHEEHQNKDQPQEVNIDPTDAFVMVVPLKDGFEVEGHGNILEGARGVAALTDAQSLTRLIEVAMIQKACDFRPAAGAGNPQRGACAAADLRR
jgi:hypothetical protein